VHTFGFGQYTSLNSSVLYNIARIFSGYNAYIPDPTNLGTAFVNGVANILTTAALEVKLNFGNKNSKFYKAIKESVVAGDLPFTKSGELLIGQVRYGQPIDILISDPGQVYLSQLSNMKLSYEISGVNYTQTLSTPVELCNVQDNIAHKMRFETIALMMQICSSYNRNDAQTEKLVKELMSTHIAKYKACQLDDNMSKGIITNCEGQLTLALEKYKYF